MTRAAVSASQLGDDHSHRVLTATLAHIGVKCAREPRAAVSPVAHRSGSSFLASISSDRDAVGKSPTAAALPKRYALPPVPLTPETDLPSANSPRLTPEEVERFKTLGFVVKRGLIPRETLLPWVDKLWQTVELQTGKFNASLSREEPSTWHDVGERWTNFTDRGHGRDLIHLTPNSQWRWHGLGHDQDFVSDSSAHPNVLRLVEELLGGPVKRPCRNRGIYSIFPRDMSRDGQRPVSKSTFDSRADTNDDEIPPAEAQLNPHLDMQPFELGGATYFSKIGPRGGGFTVWPKSHLDVYRCHEQEFIPTPKANGQLAATVARIKAETTPFEFVGDVGDVMLYHHCMVHSTGINTSDTIRMSCIQDFTRVKPRKNIMWSIEGGSHTVDGVVTFDATRTLDKDDGDRICGVLWHHDTIEWGPTQSTDPEQMWNNWNLGAEPARGHIVNERSWWDRYGLTFPVQSRTLKDVATVGPDGVWRIDDTYAVTEEMIREAEIEAR